MLDIFEPRHEPAKSIYRAFQAEAANRDSRSLEEWMAAERDAVFRACQAQASKLHLRCPTLDEVERAERYATGSVDYGATWVYQLVRVMTPLRKDGAAC